MRTQTICSRMCADLLACTRSSALHLLCVQVDSADSDDEQTGGGRRGDDDARKKKKSGGFQSMGIWTTRASDNRLTHPSPNTGLSSATYRGVVMKGYRVPTPIQRKYEEHILIFSLFALIPC